MSVIFNGLGGGTADYVADTPPSSATEGQVWFKPNDNGVPGSRGFWIWTDTGTGYWITENIYPTELNAVLRAQANINTCIQNTALNVATNILSRTGAGAGTDDVFPSFYNRLWLSGFSLGVKTTTGSTAGYTIDANNSFKVWPNLQAAGESTYISSAVTVDSVSKFVGNGNWQFVSGAVGTVVDLSTLNIVVYRPTILALNVNGTPVVGGDIRFTTSIHFRRIHP